MPDHFHLLLRPPDGDISKLMQKIKSLAARKILGALDQDRRDDWLGMLKKLQPDRKKHTHQVFQQSFRTLEIVTPKMVRQKVDYIHANPLRAELAKGPDGYRWSSWKAIHRGVPEPIAVDPVPL